MTWQEANKNSYDLCTRINLTRQTLRGRLLHYYSESETDDLLNIAGFMKTVCNGEVVIICMEEDKYMVVAQPYKFMKLLEP